MLLIKIIDVIY